MRQKVGQELKQKKVLILVNHDVVIYNFRRELVERLLADGYQLFISSPYGERIDDLIAMGCEYIETDIQRHGTNPIEDLKLLSVYRKMMKEVKPSVVLTYTIKPNIYGGMAAKALNLPYIANITGLGTAVENNGLMQKITVLLYKVSFQKVHRVFFQNTENKQFFVSSGVAVNKHSLLPGSGVNLDHFSVLKYPSEDTVEFVFVSRIMKEKGIDQYLEAAKTIRERHPQTRFHVCGFCEENYEEVLDAYEKKGIITYHGMLRDVRNILAKTHCTIHPTYYPEGMSNVLLESAACGRPIITTNRSGCREIVDDGINGYVVEQQNSQDLIDKIEKFLALSYEEKKQMGLAGRTKVEKGFDRQIVVNSYVHNIQEVLGDAE